MDKTMRGYRQIPVWLKYLINALLLCNGLSNVSSSNTTQQNQQALSTTTTTLFSTLNK